MSIPQVAKTEFWKGHAPIKNVFKLDAAPEVYAHNVADGGKRLFVQFTETVFSQPLGISPSSNRWCDYITLCREYYEKAGLGGDYIEKLFR